MSKLVLLDSVGARGRNLAVDVMALREHLVSLGYTWAAGPSTVGPKLTAAIRLFQSIVHGIDVVGASSRIDGRVDPDGNTLRWLNAANAPRWVRMTPSAPGLWNHDATQLHDLHDFGTSWLDTFLVGAGAEYQLWRTEADRQRSAQPGAGTKPPAPLTVNDASLPEGGNTPAHVGHETGLVADLRLPNRDGSAGGISVFTPTYDRDAMRAQLQALRSQPNFDVAFLNDKVLISEGLCRPLGGHDDHVHVEIEPPRLQP